MVDGAEVGKPVCGIIMPIGMSDEVHTETHWQEVLCVFEEAIAAAGLEARPVWIAGDTNIVQAKILSNLFENDIVLCDVSTLNPNVMLELGMRLTTRKPTLVVAERGTHLPFDTTIVHTHFYDPSLRHSMIKAFVVALAKELRDARSSLDAGTYRSFLEHFTFERVEPAIITVPADRLLGNKLDEVLRETARLRSEMGGLERRLRPTAGITPVELQEKTSPTAIGIDPAYASRFAIGERVFHQKFGYGAIAEMDRNKMEVDFETAGRKRVMDSFLSAPR